MLIDIRGFSLSMYVIADGSDLSGRRFPFSLSMYVIVDGNGLPGRRFPEGDMGLAMYVATSRQNPKNVAAVQLS